MTTCSCRTRHGDPRRVHCARQARLAAAVTNSKLFCSSTPSIAQEAGAPRHGQLAINSPRARRRLFPTRPLKASAARTPVQGIFGHSNQGASLAVPRDRSMGEANVSAGAAVRVLAVSRVAPSPAPAKAGEGQRVKLSFFDTPWIVLPPIQRVFLYELPNGGDEFPAAVEQLKKSLAATLALYLPLAGKLAYVAETEDVVVDCADDPGVAFVEAEVDADAAGGFDVRRLAGDEAHDIPAFLALVPELDARALPAPVLSVQATRLPGGGLALGVSVHHAVADGQAVWRFVGAWAAAARDGSPVTKALPPPHYSRDVIRVPGGDEFARQMLKMVAPNLPVANAAEYDFSQRFRLARRTFHLTADDIASLKRRIDALAAAEDNKNSNTTNTKPVSTFVALSALGWTAFVRSKGLAAGDDTYLIFLADLRARLDPPVGDGYLGNCIKGCLATADAGDLLGGPRGILAAARAVQAAVAAMAAAPMAGTERWIERVMQLPFSRLANVAASPRFRVYDAADFGFGKPDRVELVSMNHDGEMVLVGGRREGEVQLSVSLDPARMDAFKAEVLAVD